MKRYKITTFSINTSRAILRDDRSGPVFDAIKETIRNELIAQYGAGDSAGKLERYLSLKPPALSIVDEHSYLQSDISNSYIIGSFYPALTCACCLGERIFNMIIEKVKDDYRSDGWYKKVYDKGSIVDWDDAIEILRGWGIIGDDMKKAYLKLKELRHESVHYQKKDQDARVMSFEAISIVNDLITALFGISEKRKDILLYCEVPGEIFIRKDAEHKPMVKAFYIPCAHYVGPCYVIEPSGATGRHRLVDMQYDAREISDDEFVRLRNEYTKEKSKN